MDFDGRRHTLKKSSQLVIVWWLNVMFISACTVPYSKQKDSAPAKPPRHLERAQKVIPKPEPKSKYGNPPSYVVFGRRYHVLTSAKGYVEQGIASWYGTKFHGRRTSSGEPYDMYAISAAHKTLPLPTYARVTNLENGRAVTVRINDRGPFHANRIIDLSYAAAIQLDIVTRGTGLVEVRAINAAFNPDQVKPAASVNNLAHETRHKNFPVGVNSSLPAVQAIQNKINIYVQLGAFRHAENAQKLRLALSVHNLGRLSVKAFPLDAAPIYKVWLGPLNTIELADRTVAQLDRLGHQDHRIVFEPQSQPLESNAD